MEYLGKSTSIRDHVLHLISLKVSVTGRHRASVLPSKRSSGYGFSGKDNREFEEFCPHLCI